MRKPIQTAVSAYRGARTIFLPGAAIRAPARTPLRKPAQGSTVIRRLMIGVQEAERRRLAADIHDHFGGLLSTLKLHLRSASGQGGRQSIEFALEVVGRLSRDVRDLSLLLSPVPEDRALSAALRAHAEHFTLSGGVPIMFRSYGREPLLQESTRTACYRVAQEAITNALRHARPSEIRIELAFSRAGLKLAIEDDGVGFSAGKPTARVKQGLMGMRERVALEGGLLHVHARSGGGTRIEAAIPLRHV